MLHVARRRYAAPIPVPGDARGHGTTSEVLTSGREVARWRAADRGSSEAIERGLVREEPMARATASRPVLLEACEKHRFTLFGGARRDENAPGQGTDLLLPRRVRHGIQNNARAVSL